MSRLGDLKKQSRDHEWKEEWAKVLDQYKLAIAMLDEEGQPDAGEHSISGGGQ